MADQQEILNTILLTRLNYFSLAGMLELYRKVGSATLILEHKNNLRDILPDASDKLVSAIQNCEEARKRAEEELEYDIRYGIEPIPMNDDRYPQRLKDCDDAPLILFYKGTNLNQLARHFNSGGADTEQIRAKLLDELADLTAFRLSTEKVLGELYGNAQAYRL